MVRKLVEWALDNPLIVILLAVALILFGGYSFLHVNVEAYPDPAPAIVEVIALMPGASAEEVERQVTIPLEVTFAGMPGLNSIRSQSLYGLSDLKMNWNYGYSYAEARQEVINRMATLNQPLPPGVTPQISPESPTGEIYRYILKVPKYKGPDGKLRPIYTLNDIKALQDWVLEREFRTVPRIVDVTSFGGTVRRYEVQPDPDRLRRYGITLAQLQNAITNANANVGGDFVNQGQVAMTVRSISLFGGGVDPVNKVLGYENQGREALEKRMLGRELADTRARILKSLSGQKTEPPQTPEQRALLRTLERLRAGFARKNVDPPLTDDERKQVETVEEQAAVRASSVLRAEEQRRVRDLRRLVIASVNNQPVRVEDVVEGGRLPSSDPSSTQGVIVSHLTRQGQIGQLKPVQDRPSGSPLSLADRNPQNGEPFGEDEPDNVQCIVLLRKGEDSLPALKDVQAKVKELNDPANGRMLPGVEIVPYYDRTNLINMTTETVRENLLVGVVLVTVILLMFLSNVRTALIVAINIPLALMFAFGVLFLRGKSANLLSIGAVDFGIIVDSSVIMVENIYRHISSGEDRELPLKQVILRAVGEIERALLFSTLIMVCAFIPLFTMSGPEGQLFGPMAQTYAFSLLGALLLATLLSPVLCMFLFRHRVAARENILVRTLKAGYLWQLDLCLKYRGLTMAVIALMLVGTGCLLPWLGRSFMPELEEGNIWIRCTAPLNQTLERNVQIAKHARAIIATYPEVEQLVSQSGRPDDGTDPAGYFNTEYFVSLRPEGDWPAVVEQTGWRRRFSWLLGARRQRTKEELVTAMNAELDRKIPGVVWNFSQNIRDNVMEALSGVKGDNSIKIFGPDLDRLEDLAAATKNVLLEIPGIENVGVFHIRGQSHLEFVVDPAKCERYGVQPADVNNVVSSALGARAMTSMIEGEKIFDIAIRWPNWRRNSENAILDIPLDIVNNTVVLPQGPGFIPSATGNANLSPQTIGTKADTTNPISSTPRVRLRDLVSPVGEHGGPDPEGHFERPGASDIYRENGKRMIAVKFSVRDRDLASAIDEARARTKHLFQPPYRDVWSGEFEEMEQAEGRLMLIVPITLALIFILLYSAFGSVLDSVVVLSNLLVLSIGSIWALLATGTDFTVSAAVGFISILGVGVMNGLLLVSYFNALRAQGLPVNEAIRKGVEKIIRPLMMICLTAIFGLLPAALSTRIGSQTQRPLAIVVSGGMLMTLLLANLIPVLYSFYGHREPPANAGNMAH